MLEATIVATVMKCLLVQIIENRLSVQIAMGQSARVWAAKFLPSIVKLGQLFFSITIFLKHLLDFASLSGTGVHAVFSTAVLSKIG